jgi:hypothetical protein
MSSSDPTAADANDVDRSAEVTRLAVDAVPQRARFLSGETTLNQRKSAQQLYVQAQEKAAINFAMVGRTLRLQQEETERLERAAYANFPHLDFDVTPLRVGPMEGVLTPTDSFTPPDSQRYAPPEYSPRAPALTLHRSSQKCLLPALRDAERAQSESPPSSAGASTPVDQVPPTQPRIHTADESAESPTDLSYTLGDDDSPLAARSTHKYKDMPSFAALELRAATRTALVPPTARGRAVSDRQMFVVPARAALRKRRSSPMLHPLRETTTEFGATAPLPQRLRLRTASSPAQVRGILRHPHGEQGVPFVKMRERRLRQAQTGASGPAAPPGPLVPSAVAAQ